MIQLKLLFSNISRPVCSTNLKSYLIEIYEGRVVPSFRAATGLQSKLTMLKQMKAMCDMDRGRVCSH